MNNYFISKKEEKDINIDNLLKKERITETKEIEITIKFIEDIKKMFNELKEKEQYKNIINYNGKRKESKEMLKNMLKEKNKAFLELLLESKVFWNDIIKIINKALNNEKIIKKYSKKIEIKTRYYVRDDYIRELIANKNDKILNRLLEITKIDTSIFQSGIYNSKGEVVLQGQKIVDKYNQYKTKYEIKIETNKEALYIPPIKKYESYKLKGEQLKLKSTIQNQKEQISNVIVDFMKDNEDNFLTIINLKTEIEEFIKKANNILKKIEQYIYKAILNKMENEKTIISILSGDKENNIEKYKKKISKKCEPIKEDEDILGESIQIEKKDNNSVEISYIIDANNGSKITYILKPIKFKEDYYIKKTEEKEQLEEKYTINNIDKNINVKRGFLKDLYRFKDGIIEENNENEKDFADLKNKTFLAYIVKNKKIDNFETIKDIKDKAFYEKKIFGGIKKEKIK